MIMAITVTGTLRNSANTVVANRTMLFTPESGSLNPIGQNTTTATTNGSGVFSVNLFGGRYRVRVGKDHFLIDVPTEDGTYQIQSVLV